MPQKIDRDRFLHYLGLVSETISEIPHNERDDLFKMAANIATAILIDTQSNIKVSSAPAQKTTRQFICVPARKPEPITPVTNESRSDSPVSYTTEIDDQSDDGDDVAEISDAAELESTGEGPIWSEFEIDWNKYWLAKYSSPCTSQHGNCGHLCVQTELWLENREDKTLKTCDMEFATLTDLEMFCQPRIDEYNNQPQEEYIDPEIERQTKLIQEKCRQNHENRNMNTFLELYAMYPDNTEKIAAAMGCTKQSVYNYKNRAKTKGLI